MTDDDLKAIEALAVAAQEYIDVGARENWCNVKLVDFTAAMNPKMALRFCADLRAAREALRTVEAELLEKFAAYDADSLTGLNIRAILIIARKALGEE